MVTALPRSPRFALGLVLLLTAATFSYLAANWNTALSLLLHLANVGLAFFLFVETMPLLAATVGVALFAVHPVQAEVVSLAAGLPHLAATGFALVATHAWRRRKHWFSALAFLAGVAINPAIAALPAFLLLVELSYGARRQSGFTPLIFMVAASVAAWVNAPPPAGATLDRLLSAAPDLGRFVRVLVLPTGLSIWPDVDQSAATRFAAWMALAGLSGAALGAFHRLRLGFWFIAALVLIAPSFALHSGPAAAADRNLYLPMLAVAAVAGRFLESTRFPALLTISLALLSGLTYSRSIVWQSERAAWEEAAQAAPAQLRPRLELARRASPANSLELLLETKSLHPNDPQVAALLGSTYLSLHLPGPALQEFSRALALQPGTAPLHLSRGRALTELQLYDDALTDFEKALAIDPCSSDARAALHLPLPAGCPK